MMTKLLDLPLEILVLILEEVGGRNLRRQVANLLICRKWYKAAHAVYLSGLHESICRIHGCDVGGIADECGRSSLRPLMYKNTRELHIRLLGHWWDQRSKAMLDNTGSLQASEEEQNVPPAEFYTPEGRRAVMQWQREKLNPDTKELFRDLGRLEVLDRVLLETLLETSSETGPRWEYLNSSAIAAFLRNLPITKDLRHLTLDLCSGLNYDEAIDAHICDEIAAILPRLESVRLRLKLICPSLFHLAEDRTKGDIRLKSLVIKLHLPMFQETTYSTSKCCDSIQGSHNPIYLHEYLIKAAARYMSELEAARSRMATVKLPDTPIPNGRQVAHGMDLLRISCVTPSSNIYTVDCLTMQRLCMGSELFAYEDDGSPCWFEDDPECADTLLCGGPFNFTRQTS